MAKRLEHFDTTGLTLYAKPLPLVASPWVDDVVSLSESGSLGYYYADVSSPSDGYVIYEQAGGSPADSDTAIATINLESVLDVDSLLARVGGSDAYGTDSTTTEQITIAKALEALLAGMAGKAVVSVVDAATKRVQFLGRDGSTVIAQVDVSTATAGLRTASVVN